MSTDFIVVATIVAAAGLLIGYLFAASRFSAKIAKLTATGEAERNKNEWLTRAEEKLREAFEALASRALQTNSDTFTSRTRQQLIEPMQKSLETLDKQVRELETKREGAYRTLDEHITQLKGAYDQLHATTSDLTSALTTSSSSRGQWGEVQLRRIVEMAGMVPHVDFEEQERSDASQPDMIVRLPNGGLLPVDAKTTMKTYLEAMETNDNNARKAKLVAHATAVKLRIRELASKEYWKQFEKAPDFVVMFLPNDAFLSGAFEGDRDVLTYGFAQKVLLTTPVTLLALLRTVAYAWQQQNVAEHAQKIAAEAHELSDRLAVFVEHMQKTGKSLDSAVANYNNAVGSLQSRLIPVAKRFKELGVTSGEIPQIDSIDRQAKLPSAES